MKVFELPDILAALDRDAALQAVDRAFRCYSAGHAQLTSVGHLGFTEPPGDCHIKSACFDGGDIFVVKLVSSFYRNPEYGLSSSNGFMAVVSAKNGEVLALLHDQGKLTDERTAMAGAVAARAIARAGSATLGVIGAGTQGRLQAQTISRLLGIGTILVHARHAGRAQKLAADLGAEAVDLATLTARADIIVTTTPSTEPLLFDAMIRPGARIVAVGADSPGKRELDPMILARARVIVDSLEQCIDHGEAGWAVRAGLIEANTLVELGTLLATPETINDEDIVVADLTGLAVLDLAIAECVWRRLG